MKLSTALVGVAVLVCMGLGYFFYPPQVVDAKIPKTTTTAASRTEREIEFKRLRLLKMIESVERVKESAEGDELRQVDLFLDQLHNDLDALPLPVSTVDVARD